jgi:hypothetical protein
MGGMRNACHAAVTWSTIDGPDGAIMLPAQHVSDLDVQRHVTSTSEFTVHYTEQRQGVQQNPNESCVQYARRLDEKCNMINMAPTRQSRLHS